MTRIIDTTLPRLVTALALVALQGQAAAAPVDGTVTLNGKQVRVTHVAAQLHDNAEGVFDRPLTIVFADRPVPAGALDGGNALAVHKLAIAGELRGLMLRIDPNKPNEASLILLDKPADARTSLVSMSVAASDKPVIAGLRMSADKVAGSLERKEEGTELATVGYVLRFDTALLREPAPSANLQGAPLKASAPFKVATAYADAMVAGDMAAARRFMSKAMREQMDAMAAAVGNAELSARMKKGAPRSKAQLDRFTRLVERGSHAMLLVGADEYLTLSREDGEWKMGS